MKRLLILGSTGSIGKSTLEVVRKFKDRYRVVGLVAGSNEEELRSQEEEFSPVKTALFSSVGLEGVRELIEGVDFDICVAAISGSAGILPTYWAAKRAKRLALANKEALVCAGKFIKGAAREIIPVDSEHSAIFQCLNGEKREQAERLILTASGGPFWKRESLEGITPEEALKHPNWKMGKKITIDSATLMNKGLEVIEAHWLFDFPVEKIDVLIHPQSIVHSLVEFKDGSVMAQLGTPDMKIPIAYALSYPDREPLLENFAELRLSLFNKNLTFFEPDRRRFPCLELAYEALRLGYPYPIILNAADEVAVELFLRRKIGFTQIPALIREVLERSDFKEPESVEEVIEIDKEAKELAKRVADERFNSRLHG